jgi:hypothetical protein
MLPERKTRRLQFANNRGKTLMRRILRAAVLFVAMTGIAHAQPWTDEMSGLSVELPQGWGAAVAPTTNVTYVRTVSGDAAQECHFLAKPRPATAEASPYRVRLAGREPVTDATWTSMTSVIRPVFADVEAQLDQTRIDEDPFWPIQFARYQSETRIVHAAMQFRPGYEYWGFCFARSGADDPAAAEAILRSVSSTHDAELTAAVEADLRFGQRLQQDQARQMSDLQEQQERLRRQFQDRIERMPAPPPPPSVTQ